MCRAFEEWAAIEQTKGREIGRSEGLIEGHSQGLTEGRTEAFSLAETILKMQAAQKSSGEIAAACQISTAEVEDILEKLASLFSYAV